MCPGNQILLLPLLMPSRSDKYLYAFPPFSVVARVLQKIQEDSGTLLVILPLWPTQPWFPSALRLLIRPPLLLPRLPLVLPQDPSRMHPQAHKLVLTAMMLSGDPSQTKAFRRRLPDFSFAHGETAQSHSMGHISRDGCLFVSAGKLIPFTHL